MSVYKRGSIKLFFKGDPTLIGVWTLDGNAIDESGSGNHGTIFGAQSVEGKINTALRFDGVDDYMIANLNGTTLTKLTILMWIKQDLIQSKGIFQWADNLSDNTPFVYFYDNNGVFTLYVDNAYRLSTPIFLNRWHCIVVTHDGSVWRLFKDGLFISNYVGSRAWQSTAFYLYFGNGYHGFWNGVIDEVSIFSRALSPQEISAYYNWATGKSWDKILISFVGIETIEALRVSAEFQMRTPNAEFQMRTPNAEFQMRTPNAEFQMI